MSFITYLRTISGTVLFRTSRLAVAALGVAVAVAACSGAQPTAAGGPATAPPIATEVASAAPGTRTFTLDPSQSEAHFIIQEVLNGAPNTVVGKTNAVSGQIFASYDQPALTTMSPIRVDLTSIATDNNLRNGMIHRAILQTSNPAYQLAEFTMTRLSGLPDKVTVGQSFDFKITGNLTLHGVTKEETFDASVTPVSDTQLKGKASLTITYADFGVEILQLPRQVASIESQTVLEILFVAQA